MARNKLRKNPVQIKAATLVFKKRASKTAYISGGYIDECDLMLEIETESGKRYRIPAFRV